MSTDFLLRDHTHLKVDSVHSVIERKKKSFPLLSISVPNDWEKFASKTARAHNPIHVHSMNLDDFKNFEKLFKGRNSPFVNQKLNTTGEPFLISKVVQLRIRK